jgi:creatinine amidohydrolase
VRIADLSWMDVEALLKWEDRAVLPIGSTEQHAFLSLATDSLLAERVSVEAAEPLGVPVFPVIPYGITPSFTAYPGTVSLRVETLNALVRDVLDGLAAQGFRRIVVVNGHGGNGPAQARVLEWLVSHPGCQVKFHNWWNAPQVWRKVQEIDPVASHASWMENFPWTRLARATAPEGAKAPVDYAGAVHLGPAGVRARLGDGNFAGRYQRADDEMRALWEVAVAETREKLEEGWEAR